MDVVVANPDGQSATLAAAFTYVAPPAPPALASVTPACGTTAGGSAGPADVTVVNPDRQSAINVRGSPQAGGGLLLFAGSGLQTPSR